LSNRLLVLAIGAELLTLVLFVQVPVISHLLGQQPLRAVEWLPVIAAPVLFMAAEETGKGIARASIRRRGMTS
jgi:hypothetical protein